MTKSTQSLAIIVCCLLSTLARAADQDQQNVLLIITDEHNFRTMGCYREQLSREQAEMWGPGVVVTTPNLDSLAKQGVLCTRAYATAPVCSPCRAAMITGRYPHITGVPTNNLILDRTIPTLADRLNDAGYRTSFIGKWHLAGEGKPEWAPSVDGGFKFKDFMFNRGHWKKFIIDQGKPAVGATKKGNPSYDLAGADEQTFSTDWLTDRAIDFMTDQESRSQPFFTVISYPDPHGPNTVRPPYDHQFDDLRFQAPRTYQTGIPAPKWMNDGKHPVFRGADMSKYFGMVKCIDDNIGRLVERLEATGQLDNTLIVMTSDHGDLCYEHDKQNKGNPYEGSARVPMILRMPGRITASQVYKQPMGTVDVTPTVMGLLGLESDPEDQGRDLSATLADISSEKVDTASPPTIFLRNAGTTARWVGAIDARYKLILSVSDDPWLFDNDQDPDELLNFYGRPGNDGVAQRLARELRAYGAQNKDPFFDHPAIAASLARVLGEKVAPSADAQSYRSKWKGSRRWIGPDWWANPLTDWSLTSNTVTASAAADRTLCLLPVDLGTSGNGFELRVAVEPRRARRKGAANAAVKTDASTAAGFRIGRQGGIDDYRHALVHAQKWIDAKIDGTGRLSLGDVESENALPNGKGPVSLHLRGERKEQEFLLTLSATRGETSVSVETKVAAERIAGGVSLLADGPKVNGGSPAVLSYAFSNFAMQGDCVVQHSGRTFGPILWSQYTLNHGQLRLQAQLAPLGPKPNHKAELWIKSEADDWVKRAEVPMEKLSRTVTFTIDDWESETARPYQVRFKWQNSIATWNGSIRPEPGRSDPFKLACFSCDNGYLFPIPAMVSQVKQQDPDMLFFAGDQIYESYGGFGVARGADVQTAMLDYLRKYYQFGWTWRDLLRDRPSVILPDDHDVFQGNIWGHGGRKLPDQPGKPDWTFGGYLMPGEWVSAVEQTQVGHLPDPAVPMKLPIGISPYFTAMTYGGIGFAILEDRKFKTGPKSLPEDQRTDGDGADLLGAEQEEFLQSWSEDWTGQEMKCALSQTIFCRAATHTGQKLNRTKSFFDSGAWPKAARNRAVRILGDCNALAIHGDQHLGVLLRHGVEDFDDAGYALMVPGTANGFPRAWWPGVERGEEPKPGQDYTGKFHDEAGHPIHILAVGNPEPGSNKLPKTTDPMEIGYRKGSGYAVVEFDKATHEATASLYRLGDREEMFEGFPVTIKVGGKPSD